MDQAFSDLIGKITVIYQNDFTVFSKGRIDHIGHLKKIFDRCRKFGISLKLNKSTFLMDEGKLLVSYIWMELGLILGEFIPLKLSMLLIMLSLSDLSLER